MLLLDWTGQWGHTSTRLSQRIYRLTWTETLTWRREKCRRVFISAHRSWSTVDSPTCLETNTSNYLSVCHIVCCSSGADLIFWIWFFFLFAWEKVYLWIYSSSAVFFSHQPFFFLYFLYKSTQCNVQCKATIPHHSKQTWDFFFFNFPEEIYFHLLFCFIIYFPNKYFTQD